MCQMYSMRRGLLLLRGLAPNDMIVAEPTKGLTERF